MGQYILDEGLETLIVVLDITGGFDQVWHTGLLAKLHPKGIKSSLLILLEDYLQGRTLQVVVNGQTSSPCNIGVSLPQGPVL